MNDKDYDDWKLATPWDDDVEIETFQSEFGEFYSTNNNDVDLFEEELEKLMQKYSISTREEDAVIDYIEREMDNAEYQVELSRESMRNEV